MEWMVQAVLWLAILSYSGYLIRRRIRKIKSGRFCDCCEGGCTGCQAFRGGGAETAAGGPGKLGGRSSADAGSGVPERGETA